MMELKNINIDDFSTKFIKKAIMCYMNRTELNRKRVARYYATKHGKEANQMRAKIYYYKVKKKNAYHPEYNPEGIKNETQTITNTT